jgi:hypothetical protein
MHTHQESTSFIPTEIWDVSDPLDEVVEKARTEINQKDPVALIDNLQKRVKSSENGIKYAILSGETPAEYSDTDALVMFNPFANAATPNMLVRAEFIRKVARFYDIRDSNGKLKPVVMLASPGIDGSKPKLSVVGRRKIMKGDLGPAAMELMHGISTLEIGDVALLGYSQGADMVLAAAKTANSANLDVHTASVGDPAGVEKRSAVKLLIDFAGGANMKPSIERSGVEAQKESVGRGRFELARFVGSVMTSPIDNIGLGLGMRANSFEASVQQILDDKRLDKLVVGYGSDSKIAKPQAVEPALQRLHGHDTDGILSSVRINGADHTWDNQMPLLAKLYMRACA